MATLNEVVSVIGVLKLAYPSFGARLTEDEWAALTRVWHRLLRDIPFDLLDAAAAHYATISGAAFPPSIAELRDTAFKVANPNRMSAEEAWGEVQKAIRRIGFYRAPEFDDPAISFSLRHSAHFFRIYQAVAERERHNVLMLPEVRAVAARLAAGAWAALKAGK